MSLTPARTDLPQVGDYVAALHDSKQWYFGPLRVEGVDSRVIEVRPIYWRHRGTMVYRPTDDAPHPFRWNLLTDLSDAEFDGLKERDKRLQMRHTDGSRSTLEEIIQQLSTRSTNDGTSSTDGNGAAAAVADASSAREDPGGNQSSD